MESRTRAQNLFPCLSPANERRMLMRFAQFLMMVFKNYARSLLVNLTKFLDRTKINEWRRTQNLVGMYQGRI